MSEPTYLYLMECLTFGVKHPIKIGFAKNVEARCRQWREATQGGLCTVVIGYFRFPSRGDAQKIETKVRKRFPVDSHYGRYSREVLDAPADEILAAIREFTDGPFCSVEHV